jgi:hypothetical protein
VQWTETGAILPNAVSQCVGFAVFFVWRMFAVTVPFEHLRLYQCDDGPGRKLGGDAWAFLELAEARRSAEGMTENEDAPLVAGMPGATGDCALGLRAPKAHGSASITITPLVMEMSLS